MVQKNRYLFRGTISEREFRDLLRLFTLDLTADRASELTGLNHNTSVADRQVCWWLDITLKSPSRVNLYKHFQEPNLRT